MIDASRQLAVDRMKAQIALLTLAVRDQQWAINARTPLTEAQKADMDSKIPAAEYMANHDAIVEVFTATEPIE